MFRNRLSYDTSYVNCDFQIFKKKLWLSYVLFYFIHSRFEWADNLEQGSMESNNLCISPIDYLENHPYASYPSVFDSLQNGWGFSLYLFPFHFHSYCLKGQISQSFYLKFHPSTVIHAINDIVMSKRERIGYHPLFH